MMDKFTIKEIKNLKFYNKDGTPMIDARDKEPVEKVLDKAKTPIEILKSCTVPYEYWGDELFNKYGYGVGGIYEYWNWNIDLQNAEEEHIWKMIALCSIHWENFYHYSYDKQVKEHRDYMREKGDLPKDMAISLDLQDFDLDSV